MHLPSFDKVAFVLSIAVFAFLYGIATQAFGWFPSDLVQRAWNQAEAVSPVSTSYLTGSAGTSRESYEWTSPRVHDWSGVRIEQPNKIQPGVTLVSSAWSHSNKWSPGIRLLDQDGTVLHEWRIQPEEIFSDTAASPKGPLSTTDLHGSHLFPNGDVLVNVEYVGAVRLDACSGTVWKNSRYNYHHSVARDTDGSFWMPGVRRDVPARSDAFPDGYPGLEGPIHRSMIVHMSSDGEVLDTINVLDVLYKNNLERHLPHALFHRDQGFSYSKDVLHMNDVEPLPDSLADQYPLFEAGDLAVSLKFLNLVFVLDPDSQRVKWHETHYFIGQHDPDFIGNGWIGVFDNNRDGTKRGTMLGGSRIVFVQPHSDSVRIAFPKKESDPLFTDVQGKWQKLSNGNLLLTEAKAGRAVEVDSVGRTVWEWAHKPSGETTVPEVAKAIRLNLDTDKVASWPCSPDASTSQRDETVQ